MAVDSDRINYPEDCGTPTTDLLTIKLLLRSVISTTNAKFMTLDIKTFYLNTSLARYKYTRLKMTYLPEDLIEEYKLCNKVTNNCYVYVEVRKGIYGLTHSGIIENQNLEERLHNNGYHQYKYTPIFWTHASRPISFSLLVKKNLDSSML